MASSSASASLRRRLVELQERTFAEHGVRFSFPWFLYRNFIRGKTLREVKGFWESIVRAFETSNPPPSLEIPVSCHEEGDSQSLFHHILQFEGILLLVALALDYLFGEPAGGGEDVSGGDGYGDGDAVVWIFHGEGGEHQYFVYGGLNAGPRYVWFTRTNTSYRLFNPPQIDLAYFAVSARKPWKPYASIGLLAALANKQSQGVVQRSCVNLLSCARSCGVCDSLELLMLDPRLSDGLEHKIVQFSRLGLLSIVHLDVRAASPPAFCLGDLLVLESLDGLRQWEGVCDSLELPTPDPRLPDGLEDKIVQFSRLGLLSIVHLDVRAASPAFCLGDLLVLESLDGLRQWEADIRSDDQWEDDIRSDSDAKFYDSGDWNRSISVHVRTAEANSDPGLLLQKSMMIFVQHISDPSYHLTDNAKGAALRKASKATANETHMAKTKIEIGIDGYGSTGRAMARVALKSENVELVPINDSAITMDQMTCMFRDTDECGQWFSNFKIKDEDTLVFGDKEVTILRVKEPDKIPWRETDADESDADYYKTRTSKYQHFTEDIIIFGNHLSALAKILRDRFPEMKKDVATACRAPVPHIVPHNSNAAKARYIHVGKDMIFRVPAVDKLPMDGHRIS